MADVPAVGDTDGMSAPAKARTYTATLTKGGICLRECRIVAEMLLGGVTPIAWERALGEDNRLQAKSVYTARCLGQLIRARLEPLGPLVWTMVRDGDRTLATQAVMAGAVRHSRLLGDFMDLVIREQRRLFAESISLGLWADYLAGCRGRDPDMPLWSDSTVARLRSSIYSILAEAGYLSDTRSRRLQRVFLDASLVECLKDRQETYVLRCLEVME